MSDESTPCSLYRTNRPAEESTVHKASMHHLTMNSCRIIHAEPPSEIVRLDWSIYEPQHVADPFCNSADGNMAEHIGKIGYQVGRILPFSKFNFEDNFGNVPPRCPSWAQNIQKSLSFTTWS